MSDSSILPEFVVNTEIIDGALPAKDVYVIPHLRGSPVQKNAIDSNNGLSMQRVKYSSGIACCHKGDDGIVRLLMVKRRYTYAFNAFICGAYNPRSDNDIIALLDEMTVDEKLDVLSLNFQQLWYRVRLVTRETSSFYVDAYNKYTSFFCADDGARIKSLVRRSHKCAERAWEIPKGKKKHPSESDIDCAIREFYEETGIPRSAYRITPGTFHLVINESGVKYDIMYFIAIATRQITKRLNVSSFEQIVEICGIDWVAANDIETFVQRDPDGHRRIIRYVKHLLKGKSMSKAQWMSLAEHSSSSEEDTTNHASSVQNNTPDPPH